MRGTGTQADPFVIMTAEELYEMERLGGADVHCRLGEDIDFNGTPYAQEFIPIPVNWASLDGGGHKIRNILVSDQNNIVNAFRVMVSGEVVINGLFLENVVLCGRIVNLFRADTEAEAVIKLKDCSLVIKASHMANAILSGENCILHGEHLTVSSELSVIAVSAVFNRNYAVFNGDTISRTQIIVDILTHHEGDSAILETALFRKSDVSESWITGSIKCDAEEDGNSYHMTDYDSCFSNFYQAVEMNGLSRIFWNNTFSSMCFYDSDLMSGAVYDSHQQLSTLFKGLTTEQCKDPAYLTSIGFICAGENNGI